MTNIPALDVAIGLGLVYFLLSTLVSAATETLSSLLKWRSRKLEDYLTRLLAPNAADTTTAPLASVLDAPGAPDGKAADDATAQQPGGERAAVTLRSGQAEVSVDALYNAPAIASLGLASDLSARNRKPSYIPSPQLVNGVLALGRSAFRAGELAEDLFTRVGQELDALPASHAKLVLLEIYHRAGGDVVRFRREAEAWFDDCMERLSGWYKRRAQTVVWVFGVVAVIAINVDTLHIAQTLWSDSGARAVAVDIAQKTANTSGPDPSQSVSDAVRNLDALPLPLGWGPLHWDPDWSTLWMVCGWALSALAISLGAPFWFDTLSKLARLRGSGAPPPASGATRQGEGEQVRQGPPGPGDRPTNPQGVAG